MNVKLCSSSPDIRIAAFTDAGHAAAMAAQIIGKAEELGLFQPHASRQSREALRLIADASAWIRSVTDCLNAYTPGEALRIADAYDLIHRIAHRRPASQQTLGNIALRAFDARLKGDSTVDEYDLYRAIQSAINRKEKAFLGRPLSWLCSRLERWHREAAKGYSRTALSDYDILSRATILLQTDLYAFEGSRQADFKRRLAAAIRPLLDTCHVDGDSRSDSDSDEACSLTASRLRHAVSRCRLASAAH